MKALGLALFLLAPALGAAQLTPASVIKTLKEEFARMEQVVAKEGKAMGEREYPGHFLLWSLGEDHKNIRLFAYRDDGRHFSVSYFKSTQILKGHLILRRFFGPDSGGWRADTISLETGEYLGQQGATHPLISSADKDILDLWGITPFYSRVR